MSGRDAFPDAGPNDLVSPFLFVPKGMPIPEGALDRFVQPIRIPAVMFLRDDGAGGENWVMQYDLDHALETVMNGVWAGRETTSKDATFDFASPEGGLLKQGGPADDPVADYLRFLEAAQSASVAPDTDITVKAASDTSNIPSSLFQRVSDTSPLPFERARPPAGYTTAPGPYSSLSLKDDTGTAVIGGNHKPAHWPARLDPHFFVEQGKADRETFEQLSESGPEGPSVALGFMAARLYNFRRGGPWDAQRDTTGKNYRDFVYYATIAIGLYASAAGISEKIILECENLVAITSTFGKNTVFDEVYKHLPVENVKNTDIGYDLSTKHLIAPRSGP